MRKRKRVTWTCLFFLFLFVVTSVSAAVPTIAKKEAMPQQQKKYLHPHSVHLNVMVHDLPEFKIGRASCRERV